MKHHTFVCGTSKSKEQDAYYIYHNDRFWGSLHDAGITDTQIEPEQYRHLAEDYGIYLTEVVDPDHYRVAKDSEIKPHQVESGMRILVDKIKTHDPNRIAFVGKNLRLGSIDTPKTKTSPTPRRQGTREIAVIWMGRNWIGITSDWITTC